MTDKLTDWLLEQGPTVVILALVWWFVGRWLIGQLEKKNDEIKSTHEEIGKVQNERIVALEAAAQRCEEQRVDLYAKFHELQGGTIDRQSKLLEAMAAKIEPG